MVVIDLIEKQIIDFVEKIRPPREIRGELDIGYSYKDKTVEIFEIRPQWNDKSIIRNHPIAKAKYVKSKNVWKIYWMRSNGKWTGYGPNSEVKEITRFFTILEDDIHGCFWG